MKVVSKTVIIWMVKAQNSSTTNSLILESGAMANLRATEFKRTQRDTTGRSIVEHGSMASATVRAIKPTQILRSIAVAGKKT